MSDNPFDKACRSLAKLDPAGFLHWALGVPPDAFRFQRWIDARRISFPGQPERFCDTLAEIERLDAGGEPWAILLEFQISPDSKMFGRGLGYQASVWIEEKPDPEPGSEYSLGAVVVNLTGRGRSSRRFVWQAAGLETTGQFKDIDLEVEDAEVHLSRIEAGEIARVVLPMIALMQKGDESTIIERWIAEASKEPDEHRRASIGAMTLTLSEAADRLEVWQEALKEWNVTKSTVVEGWKAEERWETSVKLLLEVLEAKFSQVPTELGDAIRATKDSEALQRCVPIAVKADTLDDFRQAVKL